MLDPLSAADIAQLLACNEQTGEEARRTPLRRVLFEYYAALAPEAALTLAKTFPPDVGDFLIYSLLKVWREQDAASSLQWFRDLQREVPGSWTTLSSLFQPGELYPDPSPQRSLSAAFEDASRLAAARPQGQANGNDVNSLWLWARKSGQWEAAVARVKDLPEAGHGNYYREVYSRWAESDWRGCFAWLKDHPEAGPAEAFVRETVLTTSTDHFNPMGWDSAECTAYMTTWAGFMDGPGLIQHGVRMLSGWSRYDSAAASAWLNQQGNPPWRDQAAASLATTVVRDEPDSAFAWAESIEDEIKRKDTLAACWREWRALEPDMADAWMDERYPGLREAAASGLSAARGQ